LSGKYKGQEELKSLQATITLRHVTWWSSEERLARGLPVVLSLPRLESLLNRY